MRKCLLSSAALVGLLSAPAMAADLPARMPAPAPIVASNWTGCYVGAGGGYGMFDQEVRFVNNGVPEGLSNDVGGRGWFGTVQVGCDYQIGSNIVIGAFADYDFSGIKGDWTTGSGISGRIGDEKHKSSWAAGARIGWLPFQQLLVFVSGGYTEARFDAFDLVLALNGAPTGLSIDKHTYTGWFIGSGYEYGIGFLPGLFWKTEYRFADYGTDRVALLFDGAATVHSVDQKKIIHTVRSELVWRFNFGGGRY